MSKRFLNWYYTWIEKCSFVLVFFCCYYHLPSNHYRYSLAIFLSVPYVPCSSFTCPAISIDWSWTDEWNFGNGCTRTKFACADNIEVWQRFLASPELRLCKRSCRFCQDYGCPQCQKQIDRSLLIMHSSQEDEMFEWPQVCSPSERSPD